MKILPMVAVAACVTAACHARGTAQAQKNDGGCRVTYQKTGFAVDPTTKWSYFRDTVKDVTERKDGATVVGFNKSTQRGLVPADADKALVAAAKRSRDAGTEVHVALDESGSDEVPLPGGHGGELPTIRWIDAGKQHPSCGD